MLINSYMQKQAKFLVQLFMSSCFFSHYTVYKLKNSNALKGEGHNLFNTELSEGFWNCILNINEFFLNSTKSEYWKLQQCKNSSHWIVSNGAEPSGFYEIELQILLGKKNNISQFLSNCKKNAMSTSLLGQL